MGLVRVAARRARSPAAGRLAAVRADSATAWPAMGADDLGLGESSSIHQWDAIVVSSHPLLSPTIHHAAKEACGQRRPG
jgi:hypothetical protein